MRRAGAASGRPPSTRGRTPGSRASPRAAAEPDPARPVGRCETIPSRLRVGTMANSANIAEALRLYCSGMTSRSFLEEEVHAWDVAAGTAEDRRPAPTIDLEADHDGVWRARG